jgi:hypothetical protein
MSQGSRERVPDDRLRDIRDRRRDAFDAKRVCRLLNAVAPVRFDCKLRTFETVIASAGEAIQGHKQGLDCFVARAPRNDVDNPRRAFAFSFRARMQNGRQAALTIVTIVAIR